jgi:hypothetical protein
MRNEIVRKFAGFRASAALSQISILLVVCGGCLRAQNPVLDSYFKGQELTLRAYEAAARIAAEAQRAKIEREQIELQQQSSQEHSQPARQAPQAPVAKVQADDSIDGVLRTMKSNYPDFDSYSSDMGTLTQIFAPGTSPAFTLERYLEGLYFIAKSVRPQQAVKAPLITNAEVVALKRNGLGNAVIIAKLGASSSALTLDTDAIIQLKQDGMSDAVIAAMLELDRKRHP